MFIPRIWSSEVERIGKRKCSRFACTVQTCGELLGVLGFLIFLATLAFWLYKLAFSNFEWIYLLYILVPIAIGIVDTIIVGFSWSLVYKKDFDYDYESDTASWYENGNKITYTHKDWEQENNI